MLRAKYNKSEGITPVEAAKLLNCRVEDLSRYKLTKLQAVAPFKAPGQKMYHYLRSEVSALLELKKG